jgi:hypothetical protein
VHSFSLVSQWSVVNHGLPGYVLTTTVDLLALWSIHLVSRAIIVAAMTLSRFHTGRRFDSRMHRLVWSRSISLPLDKAIEKA